MKTLPLFITLLIVITSSLSARENPFEPTQTYETEIARLMEIEEDHPYEFQEKEDQEEHKVQKKVIKAEDKVAAKLEIKKDVMIKKPMVAKKIEMKKEPMVAKKVVMPPKIKEMIQPKPMKKMALVEPLIIKKQEKTPETITLENAMDKLDNEKIAVQVPTRENIEVMKMDTEDIHENFDILPFVNIDYTNEKILISSKYEVFRKFTIDKSKKIVLDYHAKTFFLTKSKNTKTAYFEKVVAGNHLNERYFRIVVVLKDKPNKYKVTYSNNLVTIEFDKDMI
mgnify:CR=1 FL=1